MTALADWSAPAADPAAMRLAAARLEALQQRWQLAARRLRTAAATLAHRWRGEAADAALRELEELARAALAIADAHAQAVTVLLTCARAVEEAQATWQRAAALEAQDLHHRAERQRAAARGAFVGPYDLEGAALRRQARAVAEQAHVQADEACARATGQLQALAAQATTGRRTLTAADQLAGVGRGAAEAVRGTADLLTGAVRTLSDPAAWPGAVRGLVEGLTYGARHPREAVGAATGWDLLERGRYGEWAGGFVPDLLTGAVTGGSVPAGRRAAELADDLDDLERGGGRRTRGTANAGGPVRPQPGVVLVRGYPRLIQDLAPKRRVHILDGDPPPRQGGGHRPGAGRGKTEFPHGWTDDEIIRAVMETATRPHGTATQPGRRTLLAHAEHAGVCVRAVVDPRGRIVTGHPLVGEAAERHCPPGRSVR